jgi:hypothetical protein
MKRVWPVLLALFCLVPAAEAQTKVWSTAPTTQQVDPKAMDRSEPVRNAGPVDSRIVGAWDVWIAGAVTYSTDGRAIYQQYSPGAAMNRLEIGRDGAYQWGSKRGRLVEVRPWHAQDGRRYFQAAHANGTEYDFYYKDGDDKLVVLFGGVGGHAASGTRLGGSAPAAPDKTRPAPGGATTPTTPATAVSAMSGKNAPARTDDLCSAIRPGQKVQVSSGGQWYASTVIEGGRGTYKVRYDGWGSAWDEWVAPSRIRTPHGEATCHPATR